MIKRKSDVFKRFCEWKMEVKKSLGEWVKTLCTDNRGEYTSNEFEEYLRNEGIKHELTISKCTGQVSGLVKSFWAEALATAVYFTESMSNKSYQREDPIRSNQW